MSAYSDTEFDPNAEVDGEYVVSFIESAGSFKQKLKGLLAENGISDPDSSEWYEVGKVASAYETVADEIGYNTVKEAGKETGKAVPFPEDLTDPQQAFEMLNEMQQQAHRNSSMEWPVGKFTYESLADSSIRVGVTNGYPYPEPLVEGIAVGIVESISPESALTRTEEMTTNADEKVAFKVEW